MRGIREKRLREQVACPFPDRGQFARALRRQKRDRSDTQSLEQVAELVFDHVGQRTDHEQRPLGRGRSRHLGHERRETGVFALRERRFDAATRVVQHPDVGHETVRQAFGRASEVELDDFRRTGSDQEQELDVGTALEQLADLAVELVVHVGEPGQVALVDDRGGEARLGEDHHAGRGLDQVSAGPRPDDEEECILDLPVQPDDAGQAAEHLALAALADDHAGRLEGCCGGGAAAHGFTAASATMSADACFLARRNFQRNWAALIT